MKEFQTENPWYKEQVLTLIKEKIFNQLNKTNFMIFILITVIKFLNLQPMIKNKSLLTYLLLMVFCHLNLCNGNKNIHVLSTMVKKSKESVLGKN
jgi:hypothetical protein